jgi:uncharacterized protein YdhG (YjbR/CyaY superfamily)
MACSIALGNAGGRACNMNALSSAMSGPRQACPGRTDDQICAAGNLQPRGSQADRTVMRASWFRLVAALGEVSSPGLVRMSWQRASGCAPVPTRWLHLPMRLSVHQNEVMSAQEIDEYLDGLEEPKRTTLARLRQTILDILPEADQGISYGVPAFKVGGKTIAGFAAFKNHLSYLPHSGSVFPQLSDELQGYSASSGALRFGVDEPLPVPLVEKLIAVRLRQVFPA